MNNALWQFELEAFHPEVFVKKRGQGPSNTTVVILNIGATCFESTESS
jgi:hypothetical protein